MSGYLQGRYVTREGYYWLQSKFSTLKLVDLKTYNWYNTWDYLASVVFWLIWAP